LVNHVDPTAPIIIHQPDFRASCERQQGEA
jgi:hypothetical protein